MCVKLTHITYYKRINPRVNTGLVLLLYVCVAHTHEPNRCVRSILCMYLYATHVFKILKPHNFRRCVNVCIRSFNYFKIFGASFLDMHASLSYIHV